MPLQLRHTVLCAALLATPAFTSAQEAVPAAAGVRSYEPEFFARYSPRNALEMLENVPGFVIRAEVVERGLGQATGNVLLNGQRLSGKSNDALSQLQRVAAANVLRIEILDGATLDIPGLSGQVANVVSKAGGLTGTWRWRPDVRKYFTDPNLLRFDASVSASTDTLDWTLGLMNNASHSGAGEGGGTVIRNADGSVREQRRDIWTSELQQPQLSAQLSRKGDSGSITNLNALFRDFDYAYEEEGVRFGNPDVPDRERGVESTEVGHNAELGGDHEFGLGIGRLKLIGLAREVDSETQDTVITDFVDGSPTEGIRFAQEGVTTERIGRAEYRWKHAGHDWQVSGEYAFNELDSTSELFLLDAGGAFQPDPDFGGNDVVSEDRFEIMGTYGRPLGKEVTLQVSAGAEYSEITAGGVSRDFVRPKGLVSVAWKASDTLDIGVKLERRVGQLNFYDFLASVDVNDDQENAGNFDLVPPQTSELQFEATKNLGAWGTTSLRVYGQRVDDIVDTIPIGDDGESPGNIDTATVVGFQWKASIELAPLGWKGAKIDTDLHMEHSRLEDPLTGEQRPISNNLAEQFEIGLRHDVPDTEWAWGSDIGYYFNEKDYRLTEVGRFWEGPYWGSLFVERKNWHGLTLRATASNLLDARSKWNRTVYQDRRTGPVDFYQTTNRRIGPILSFTVSGKF